MFKTINWTERKFSFDFAPEIFPCIVERLRGTPARLDELLHSLPEYLLVLKIEDKWSVQEHAGHLIDLEELGEIRLQEFLSGKKELTGADMSNLKTYKADHNLKAMVEILKKFRNVRSSFVKKLEDLKREDVVRFSFHPRLKKEMRLADWAFFIAEHDDHHLAKINEIANMHGHRVL